MTTTTAAGTPDADKPDADKAARRAGWSEQARAWSAHLEVIERQWAPVSDGLLELTRVATGDRVLDLASGAGDPALAAAARVGPTGSVIATDLSPDMLAFAAQRAAAAGLGNLEVHEMDAEEIDLPDESVDVVLCRLGLMFLPDLARALAGVRRVLVPGGRFAAAIPWRPEDQAMPRLVGTMLDAIGLPRPPPAAPGRPGIFSLADAGFVRAELERAGLGGIRIVPFTITHDYRSADEWIDFVLALNVQLRQHLAGLPDERVREGRRAAVDAASAYVHADGHVRFPGHGYYATATRPAGTRPAGTRPAGT